MVNGSGLTLSLRLSFLPKDRNQFTKAIGLGNDAVIVICSTRFEISFLVLFIVELIVELSFRTEINPRDLFKAEVMEMADVILETNRV